MFKLSRAACAAVVSVFLLASCIASRAAEVRVLAVGALVDAFKELVPPFEKASGHKLVVQYGASPVLLKQMEGGDPFDLAIVIADTITAPHRRLGEIPVALGWKGRGLDHASKCG